MKITLTLLLCLIGFNLYSQDCDDNHRKHHSEKENKKDYYTLGIYSGYYRGNVPLLGVNAYINNITLEFEYFKFEDLSVLARYTYQFTKTNLYELEGIHEGPLVQLDEPKTSRINLSLIGRYYLGGQNFRPYVQMGINNEINSIGGYTVRYYNNQGSVSIRTNDSYPIYRYSINIGAGLSIKLSEKFSLDMKYDIYKSLGKNNGIDEFYDKNSNTRSGFNGFSNLVGIKYNL